MSRPNLKVITALVDAILGDPDVDVCTATSDGETLTARTRDRKVLIDDCYASDDCLLMVLSPPFSDGEPVRYGWIHVMPGFGNDPDEVLADWIDNERINGYVTTAQGKAGL